MGHIYHNGQPGYSPGQLLVDGCRECELRGRNPRQAIEYMDNERWHSAWDRARMMGKVGLPDASAAELPLLQLLWQVIVSTEQAGVPPVLLAIHKTGRIPE